jgi:hypothetical protein
VPANSDAQELQEQHIVPRNGGGTFAPSLATPSTFTAKSTHKRSPHSRRNMTATELGHASNGVNTAAERELFVQLLPNHRSGGKGNKVDFANMAMEWKDRVTVRSPDDIKVNRRATNEVEKSFVQ